MKLTLAAGAVALATALTATMALAPLASAQEGESRPPVNIKGPDGGIIQAAVDEIRKSGECRVVFVVSKEGKPDKIEPKCSVPEYEPFAAKAIAAAEYEPELIDGVPVPTNPMAQTFSFAVQEAAAQTPPVKVADVNARTVQLAFRKIKEPGSCKLTFMVRATGAIEDLKAACDPAAYEDAILRAAKDLKYQPGTRDGQPVDWPDAETTLTIGVRAPGG
ncbi:hypothetical protein GC169_02270 [bacterium]|nr:hypothetical protein [bacterium]